MPDRRRIVVNPDEPRTGDFAYQFYDKAHPHFGDQSTINRVRRELRGLRGKRVTVVVHAGYGEEGEPEKRRTFRRTITLKKYGDIFGPGGAYGEMMHELRNEHSEAGLYAYAIDVIAA